MTDPARSAGVFTLAGGWCWFDRVEVLSRAAKGRVIPAADVPAPILSRLTAPRAALAGLAMDRPRLMGILNVTPDSFSDGGKFLDETAAVAQAWAMAEGAEIIDIGGESTRPGAVDVSVEDEISRTAPVIRALRAGGLTTPVSIDTRKTAVAQAALQAGATIVNDVSAFDFDPALGPMVAASGAPVVLMHAQGVPATMQDDPSYGDVLLDVYDALAARLARAEALGIDRDRIVLDPGIGFGKSGTHNLALLYYLFDWHRNH